MVRFQVSTAGLDSEATMRIALHLRVIHLDHMPFHESLALWPSVEPSDMMALVLLTKWVLSRLRMLHLSRPPWADQYLAA